MSTDAPLRAQIKLLDALPELEASARQVLAELRAGANDLEAVQKLKQDEAEFAESLRKHLEEQQRVVALLKPSGR